MGVLKNIRRLKLKVLAAIFALVALTNGLKVKLNDRQCGPDETSCPAGCCPEANWFCCPDNMYCAATAADCPFVAKKAQLMRMAKNKQCGPPYGTTWCGDRCCPEANWFCCPGQMWCAATADDCPFVAKKAQLMKMAKNKQCGPDETSCPAGC